MNEKGELSNFLIMKLGLLIAVATLLVASITMYDAFQRTSQREKLKSVPTFVKTSIHETSSLPGEVHLERKIPEVSKPYEIIISGSFNEYQIIQVIILGSENLKKTFLLNKKVNGGKFRIGENNPKKIKLSKNSGISLEVI